MREWRTKPGKFVYPTIETVAAAAASKPDVNSTDFSIVDAVGGDSYPISGYSWVMLYEQPSDPARAKLVRETMEWLVTKGQAVAKSVDYVPLPENVQQRAIKLISSMKG